MTCWDAELEDFYRASRKRWDTLDQRRLGRFYRFMMRKTREAYALSSRCAQNKKQMNGQVILVALKWADDYSDLNFRMMGGVFMTITFKVLKKVLGPGYEKDWPRES